MSGLRSLGLVGSNSVTPSVVGDGSTDDTALIQTALDAVHAAGGGKVVLPPHLICSVQPLKMFGGVTLDLNGSTLKAITRVGGTNIWDALIYTAGCTAANGCTGDGATQVDDSAVVNGTIDTLGRCYTAIKAQNASRFRVVDVRFPSNQDKIAVRLDFDTDNCEVRGCHIVSTLDVPFDTITNAQGVSIFADTGDANGGAYGSFGSGTVNATAFNAVAHPSAHHIVTDNRIEGGTHGIAIQGGEKCVVANNVITDPSHRGVILSPIAHRNVVADNVVMGTFSCAFLLAFGSRFNSVTGNVAYCTNSVSELNAYRASFGASDNLFADNYAFGTSGPAYRAFTGAINNTFTGNKAESCAVGLEFRSLVTDDGYQQNVNTPAMTGNAAIGNDFVGCGIGIRLRSGTTTTGGTTPATAAGTAVALTCALLANRVRDSTTYGVIAIEDTAGDMTHGVNACVGLANAIAGSGTQDWNMPRTSGHWAQFQANAGSNMQGVHRLPATGNADEWRDSTDVLKALISSTGAFATAGRHSIGGTSIPTACMAYLNTASNGNVGYRVDGQAGQTVDLQQWTKGAGNTAAVAPLSAIGKNGEVKTAVHSAPADADLQTGEVAFWFDQTPGATKLMVKGKDSGGTVRTATVAMA